MLAIVRIHLDFDLHLQCVPTPIPVHDGISSDGVTATVIKGTRQSQVRVLPESSSRFVANPTESYNVLEIVFRSDSFRRFVDQPRTPSNAQVERAANDLLSRLAFLSGAASIFPLTLKDCAWKLDYLHDDGTELLAEDGKFRGHETMSVVGGTTIFAGANLWSDLAAIPPNFSAPAWHALLGEADRALPSAENALLLAAIALEVFIEISISEHSKNSLVPDVLWRWISSRNAGKGPSTGDQYTVLLEVICGKTLKSVPPLWLALREIQEARNSFAHNGTARIADHEVSESRARELLSRAREIISTVNAWLMPTPSTCP